MSDLISRSALIEAMEKKYEVAKKKAFYSVGLSEGFIVCEEIINEQPTIEVKPVVHGEWIRQNKEKIWGKSTEIVCSICGKKSWLEYDFCPNCGSDMRKQGGMI